MKTPTTPTLVLAYRKAKTAFASERSAIGFHEFAEFESSLPSRLKALRSHLANEPWFDNIPIGRIAVVPKSSKTNHSDPETVRVGITSNASIDLAVRLQLVPTPEFAIVELLYLREFGPAFEALLSPSCVGYRLKRVAREGKLDDFDRDVYEYWPEAFRRYRDEPIQVARKHLRRDSRVLIVSTDVANFFDSLDPGFLLTKRFKKQLAAAASDHARPFDTDEYDLATRSLLRQFRNFRRMRTQFGSVDTDAGVPIGSLTSRLFGNAVLAGIDSAIQKQAGVVCYKRYVDDIVIVKTLTQSETIATRSDALGPLLPEFLESETVSSFRDPITRCKFTIKNEKTRIHLLEGTAGIDFLSAVQQAFSVVTSERRALFGDIEKLEQEVDNVVDLFGGRTDQMERIPRLRDADHYLLRRFVATTVVKGLQRAAVLLDRENAQQFIRTHVERTLSVLDSSQNIDDFDFVLLLLRVALLGHSWEVVERLMCWLQDRLSTKFAEERYSQITWCSSKLRRKDTLPALRKYIRTRIEETIAAAGPWSFSLIPCMETIANMHRMLKVAICNGHTTLFFHAGLRHLDMEDDFAVHGPTPDDAPLPSWHRRANCGLPLGSSVALQSRLDVIGQFLAHGMALGEQHWRQTSCLALFLSAKPLSYFDISRRLLARISSVGSPGVGERITECVDAIRGTRYSRCSSHVSVARTQKTLKVCLQSNDASSLRVILANLSVRIEAFERSIENRPLLTTERLRMLDHLLRQAKDAARQGLGEGLRSILLLPELSIPNRWVRALGKYSVSAGLPIVAGVEYTHRGTQSVFNQAIGIFPTHHQGIFVLRWTKRHPATGEKAALKAAGLSLRPATPPRLVVEISGVRLGVLICSELLEAAALSSYVGEVELLLVPAWNTDTNTFEHAGFAAATAMVHAFVCISNNSSSSDCRVLAPIRTPRHERDWCRLVQRGENTIIWADLPTGELAQIHAMPDGLTPQGASPRREYFPSPPGAFMSTRKPGR